MNNKDIEGKAFLGRGWKFPPEFRQGYNSAVLSQFEEDIQESLIILLSTIRGERVMRPDYGSNIEDLLFEPLDLGIASLIGEEVKQSILVHEPRVFVDRVETNQDTLQGYLELSIDYTIIATNTRTNLVYPFYLNEGTDVE